MSIELIKNTIEGVDWSQYVGPTYYKPEDVAPALVSLLNVTDASKASSVGDRVLFAIGNNHAGTYYPAILSALDIIIEIEKEENNSISKLCACAILSDLSSFEPDPDLGDYKGNSLSELIEFAQNKLEPYSD